MSKHEKVAAAWGKARGAQQLGEADAATALLQTAGPGKHGRMCVSGLSHGSVADPASCRVEHGSKQQVLKALGP